MNFLTTIRRFIRHHRGLHLGFTILLILFSTLPPAVAGDILRSGGGASTSAGQPAVTGLGNAPANVISNRSNARDILIRAQTSQTAARALQVQARAAAMAGANNLGTNPNNPAETLPNVPNGLGVGGLEVLRGRKTRLKP